MEIKYIIIISIIIGIIAGAGVGYVAGFGAGLNWAFDKAIFLLDKQGIEINFNEDMIKAGLFQYKNNVGGCLFVDAINKTI